MSSPGTAPRPPDPATARWKKLLLLLPVLVVGGVLVTASRGDAARIQRQHTTWMDYGGGPDQSKYVVVTGLDRSKVHRLEVASELGGVDTGVPETLRNGIVVTSTGIVFSNAKDGKIYAFDEDDGRELWSASLPSGTEGIPAPYEVNGRHYLVVSATTPIVWSRRTPEGGSPERGYIVFALPE